jgi:hypothetical protein
LKKLERLRLIAKRLSWANAKGEHPSSRRGFSLEFSDYRRYQQGDDLRYVDWNIYRRLDRLLLKVFTADEEMNVYLLVDTSRSMAEGTPPGLTMPKKLPRRWVTSASRIWTGSGRFVSSARRLLTRGGRECLVCLTSAAIVRWRDRLRSAAHSSQSLPPSRPCRHRERFVRSRWLARRS